MSSLVDDDTRRITGGDGRQLSEDVAGFGNHEEPEEMQPRHYDIVPRNQDGDVIFGCNGKVSFLVSSAVLRLTSKVFRALLDGKFKEDQELRTAANPQKIPAEVGDSHALHRLFCLLHHQCDPDTTLFPTNLADNQIAQSITAFLVGFCNLERMQRTAWCDEHETKIFDTVGPADFRWQCRAIDNTDLVGLCLT
jgi:hypothetical protein